MEYILDISAQGQAAERCSGPAYHLFLDYAFTQADFFMLAFVNYYGKGLPARARQARAQLAPFRVRSRTNPSWPGTPETCCPNTTYKINVYRCCDAAKQVLQAAYRLSDWSRPKNAEDLAFFKGGQCWFYSVGHERIAAFLHATEEDLRFVRENGLAEHPSLQPYSAYYDAYDEALLTAAN